MAFGIGDSLTVNIDANTINFSRKVGGAQEDIQDLATAAIESSGGLQVLANRADNAGDQIAQAGRRAGVTSGLFAGLSFSTSGLSLNLGGLATSATVATVGITALTAGATALVSTLVPLAAVVGTLAGGVTALAGAFGTVIGTGILAFGAKRGEQNAKQLAQVRERIKELKELEDTEKGLTDTQEEQLEQLEDRADKLEETTGIMGGLKDAISDLVEELKPLIVDFGEAFIPLIEDSIDAIPDLVENTLDAVGGLEVFVDALRDMGEAAMTAIPNLVAGMADLARRALPVFIDMMQWLGRNGSRIFMGMLRTTQRLAPTLMSMVNAFIRALPEINRLGIVVLETLIPAFVGFIETVEDIVNFAEGKNGIVGFIKALVNRAVEWVKGNGISTIQSLGSNLLSAIQSALNPAEGGEGGGFTNALIARVKDLLNSAEIWLTEGGGKTQISEFVTSLFGSIKTQLDQIGDDDISNIVNSLATIIGSVFDALVTSANSDEAEALGGRVGELANTLMAQLGSTMFDYVTSDAFITDMARVAVAVTNVLGAALSEAFSTKPLVDAVFGQGTFESTAGQLDTTAAGVGGGTSQSDQTNIEINVTGDSEVVKDISASIIEDRERRTNRTSGARPNPTG